MLPSSFAVATLTLLAASSALACIQGHHLPRVAPSFEVPVSHPPKAAELRFDSPKLAAPDLHLSLKAEERPPTFVTADEAIASYARIVAAYEAMNSAHASVHETTDYAASLIFLGRASEAIPVLNALEKSNPGLYPTAANLGTAYELTGDLEQALTWIREGIARNPDSHDGTEWLHVAILQAKLALKHDASWLTHHSVLDQADAYPAEETLRAIEYQLNERLRFVDPPDPVVCDLFYQAALRVDATHSPDLRVAYFDESLRFGDLRKAQIATRSRDT